MSAMGLWPGSRSIGQRGVSEVVERPNVTFDLRSRKSGSQRLLERLSAVDRPALRVTEDELVTALERGPRIGAGERLRERGGESDSSLSLLRLRLADAQDAFEKIWGVRPAAAQSNPRAFQAVCEAQGGFFTELSVVQECFSPDEALLRAGARDAADGLRARSRRDLPLPPSF